VVDGSVEDRWLTELDLSTLRAARTARQQGNAAGSHGEQAVAAGRGEQVAAERSRRSGTAQAAAELRGQDSGTAGIMERGPWGGDPGAGTLERGPRSGDPGADEHGRRRGRPLLR